MAKQMIGKVVSTKMEKTVVVEITSARPHRLYKKVIRRSRRFKVHNENEKIVVGDKVRIGETKPLSKEKHWKVLEVVR